MYHKTDKGNIISSIRQEKKAEMKKLRIKSGKSYRRYQKKVRNSAD